MSLCASCGLQLLGDFALCPHHHYHCVYGDDWAVTNRVMCDFIHRKKVPVRLPPGEREDSCAETRDVVSVLRPSSLTPREFANGRALVELVTARVDVVIAIRVLGNVTADPVDPLGTASR